LRPGEGLCLQLADIEYGRRRVVIRDRTDHPKRARTRVTDRKSRRSSATGTFTDAQHLCDARASKRFGQPLCLPGGRSSSLNTSTPWERSSSHDSPSSIGLSG
jgi:hypothetical protein